MNKYVADTMVLVLQLEKRKFPEKAKKCFEEAERGNAEILIPAMVFAELAYLSERERIDTDIHEANKYVKSNNHINEVALGLSLVKSAFEIDDIPELHDRLIAAAGKHLNIPIQCCPKRS